METILNWVDPQSGPLGWRRPRLPAPLSPALPAPQPAPLPALLPAPLSTLLPALLAALCAAGCGSASDSYVVGSAKWRGPVSGALLNVIAPPGPAASTA